MAGVVALSSLALLGLIVIGAGLWRSTDARAGKAMTQHNADDAIGSPEGTPSGCEMVKENRLPVERGWTPAADTS